MSRKDPLRNPRPAADPDAAFGATTPTELLLALAELKRTAYARYWSLRRSPKKPSPEILARVFARIEGINASIELVERALRAEPDLRIERPRATVKRCPRCRVRHRINPDAVAPVRRWVRREKPVVADDGAPVVGDTTPARVDATVSASVELDDLPF
jgi:hypothetical protein